jgi:hypothetical protein
MLFFRKLVGVCAALMVCWAAIPALAQGSARATGPSAPTLPENPSISDVISRLSHLARRPAGLEGLNSSQSLKLLLQGRDPTGHCATPLILALEQERKNLTPEARAFLDRLGETRSPGSLTQEGPGPQGYFNVTYTLAPSEEGGLDSLDADRDGIPDEAYEILFELQEARSAVIELFEFSGMPVAWPSTGEPVHQVVITDLPGDLAGYLWPAKDSVKLILDREALAGSDAAAILRHQIAHIYQIGLTADESPWWYEAHATWAADPAGIHARKQSASIAAYLDGSRSGLSTGRLAAWAGSMLWPHYLATSGMPSQILGMAWEEMASVPGPNTLAGFEGAASRARGTSLAEEVRLFRIWNIFLGPLDDGNHYAFGGTVNVDIDAYLRNYPAFWRGGGPVSPLGGEAVHLATNPLPGGWLLEFEGDMGARWDLVLITLPARLNGEPAMARLKVIDGKASAAVPWGEFSAVIALVQNIGGERPDPSTFSLSARYDPLVPFDLMSFAPEPMGGANDGVALRWHTENEIDMLGWRVFRSRDPLAGFAPIHSLLIPATGGPEVTSYIFMDQTAVPGRKYYYFIEGVTVHGFTEITHPVSVRMPRHQAATGH